MKDLLTKLTEAVGNSIASKENNNMLNEANDELDKLNPEVLLDILKDEPELWNKIKNQVKSNPKFKEATKKPKLRLSRSSSSGSCGNNGGSAYCGYSTRSHRSSGWYGGCGGYSSSRGGC